MAGIDEQDWREHFARGPVKMHCNENGSDKVYDVSVVQAPAGCLVEVCYGRRVGGRKYESKTPNGYVAHEEAIKIAAGLVKSKIKGGYRIVDADSDGGVPCALSAMVNNEDTGLRPQLLTAINLDDLAAYIANPRYGMQEKFDGERSLIRRDLDGNLIAANRRGMRRAIPAAIVSGLAGLHRGSTVDGELLGDRFVIFDLLEVSGNNIRTVGFQYRWATLVSMDLPSNSVAVAETAFMEMSKASLLSDIQARGGEGAVFKLANSPYAAERNIDQVKCKFWHSLSGIALPGRVGKRSVSLWLYDSSGVLTPVGNVTVPANMEIPAENAVVEVRYLYAYQGGSLFQPVLLSVRSDILPEDCRISQCVFKPEPSFA